ncbi:MAG: glycoside hydrolase family 16 protein, partial [Propionibacteriaceae bacterium]|nr:glycoside hydrolase family 16 protein [Propionibacteriaceae bacterium]
APGTWSKARGTARHPYNEPINPELDNASFHPDYTTVADGSLRIRWDRTPNTYYDRIYEYTTGIATTAPGFAFKYGFVEARVKVPNGPGLWRALWLLPLPVNTWPPEIDIAEWIGQEDGTVNVKFNLHWRSLGQHRQIQDWPTYATDVGGDWHIYGMHWEKDRITVYFDGSVVYEYEGPGIPREEMYLVISGGVVRGAYPEPGEMLIDYVRVWQ